MTDVFGDIFLSYRRSQSEIAREILRSLLEHGVPVWQDTQDLRTEPVEDELIDVIRDRDIAGGVVLVSRDVVDSKIILRLELPELYTRWQDDDEFFVVVAVPSDITYEGAEDILEQADGVLDFSTWNMSKLSQSENVREKTKSVTEDVISERISAITSSRDANEFDVAIDTYTQSTYSSNTSFHFDWTHHFEDGYPSGSVWNERLLPSIAETISQLEEAVTDLSLIFRGHIHLPAAFCIGGLLSAPRGIPSDWMQQDPTGGSEEPWSLKESSSDCPVNHNFVVNDVTGSNLCVMLSVTNDVGPAVDQTKDLPDFGGVLDISVGRDIEVEPLEPSEAVDFAQTFRRQTQSALNDLNNINKLHIYMALPCGLAFLCGQMTNTFPDIQTYILDTDTGARAYERAAVI